MLAESLLYLRSFRGTPPDFRAHLSDAIGLWARGRRQQNAWKPHLERCRSVIETAIGQIPSRRTVAVLGSGPCFDLPLTALARAFERVVLIDQAHLASLGRQLASHRNVERMWRDLAPLGDIRPLDFLREIDGLDWVISLNLLSQLGRAAPEGEERTIIDDHLAGLSTLPCRGTLLTDTFYRVTDRSGAVLEEMDLMHGRQLPRPTEQWDWDVAPLGEEGSRTRRVHTVAAWPAWPRAAGTNGFIR